MEMELNMIMLIIGGILGILYIAILVFFAVVGGVTGSTTVFSEEQCDKILKFLIFMGVIAITLMAGSEVI